MPRTNPPSFSKSYIKKHTLFDVVWGKVFMDDNGKTYLYYDLEQFKPEIIGKYVSPLTCWRRENLCFKRFKRPHISCFRCDLRLAVSGKKPRVEPIGFQIILLRHNANMLDRFLAKLFCSLAEWFG